MKQKKEKPIKSLLITHGNLGDELKNISEKILERPLDLETISILWGEDGTEILSRIEVFIKKHAQCHIIIFTDMFGGSPSNLCFPFISSDVEVISGINLPGLLKFLTYRNKGLPFPDLVRITRKGAIDGINIIGEYLGEKSDGRRKS